MITFECWSFHRGFDPTVPSTRYTFLNSHYVVVNDYQIFIFFMGFSWPLNILTFVSCILESGLRKLYWQLEEGHKWGKVENAWLNEWVGFYIEKYPHFLSYFSTTTSSLYQEFIVEYFDFFRGHISFVSKRMNRPTTFKKRGNSRPREGGRQWSKNSSVARRQDLTAQMEVTFPFFLS